MRKESVCLVLGANGFIGSYLVEHLSQQPNMHIRAFDRFSHEPQFNVAHNVEVVKGDIFDDNSLRTALVGADQVFHSFSATTPYISDNNPYIDITDNLSRSVKIFDICADEGVKKIGFISSGGAVYGSLAESKVASESDAPFPVSPYGINKLSIEYYLEYFKRKHGIDYVVYRLTNPYGPRQILKHNQGVIPTFIQRINNNDEIIIYGDGTSSRDYIYIEDAAAMIARSFLLDNKYTVYNVGRGIQTSLNEVIKELKTHYGHPFQVVYNDAPRTFLHSTGVNIDRYMTEFEEPLFTPLSGGLKATIEYLKNI